MRFSTTSLSICVSLYILPFAAMYAIILPIQELVKDYEKRFASKILFRRRDNVRVREQNENRYDKAEN